MRVLASLLCLVAFALVAQADFNDAVQQLASYQDSQSGAFQSNANSAPTLAATTDALFLSSLYGLGTKINSFLSEQYLQSLRTADNGFSATVGGSSSLEATYNAVVSHVHLGKEVPQSSAVVSYVLSLHDGKMFSNTAGSRGNIKSTYQAIAVLRALDSIESLPVEIKLSLETLLNGAITATPTGKYFAFTNVPATQSNFYGVFIWESLDENVLPAKEIFEFILSQQSPSGGFFSDLQHTSVSFETSALALSTLGLLEKYSDKAFASQINAAALANYCKTVPSDLSESAAAHKAVAHTTLFSENFKIIVEYGGADTRGSHVLQGTQLRPEVVVRSFNGPSHSNLDVSVKFTDIDGQPKDVRMPWDEDNQRYVVPQGIDTSNRLGQIVFDYTMHLNVFGVSSIRFQQSAEKNVGFRVNIIPTATNQNTGASINEGEAVSAGTDFEFDVKLSNKTHSNIKSGEFTLSFTVYDSSYVAISEQSLSGIDNEETFKFEFTLGQIEIPSGALSFVFAANDLQGNTYSNDVVSYSLNVPMIATEIEFNKNEFKLGESLSVSFAPASSPDLRSVNKYSAGARKFFLDVSSSSGVVVNSFAGKEINGKIGFEYSIPASYDSLGTFTTAFRYETAQGDSIDLDNFVDGEVSEEALAFAVGASLEAKILEKPESTNFFYGNDVSYRFRVSDKDTGSAVALGQRGGIFLTLNHFDETKGKSFVSTKLPAVQDGNDLVVDWKVNPNAANGDGTLVLIAEGAGGDDISLLVDGSPFSTSINIGGDIKEEVSYFSTSDFYSSQTAFIVEFELSCNEVPLRDVKLRAVISYEGEEIQSTPVGVSGDKYLASWNSLHIESPSGSYSIQLYREADQQRATDNEDNKLKQLRAKQREAELSGETFDEEKFLASLESVEVEPLFSVVIPHTQVSRGGLPFGSEWLVFLPVVIGFLYFDNVKRQYRKGTRK